MSIATGEPPPAAFARSELSSRLTELQKAILLTVHYRDVFRHALSEQELHTYLIGRADPRDALWPALQGLPPHYLSITNGLITWRGQEHLARERQRRLTISATLWQRARSYGRLIQRIPFV